MMPPELHRRQGRWTRLGRDPPRGPRDEGRLRSSRSTDRWGRLIRTGSAGRGRRLQLSPSFLDVSRSLADECGTSLTRTRGIRFGPDRRVSALGSIGRFFSGPLSWPPWALPILRRLLVLESPAREGAQSADLAGDARPRFGDADRPTYRRDRLETSIATAISDPGTDGRLS